MSARQFQNFRAASLFCRQCAKPMPVREKLLLVLPDKELFDYLCSGCGSVVGSREVSAAEKIMRSEGARSRQQVRIL